MKQYISILVIILLLLFYLNTISKTKRKIVYDYPFHPELELKNGYCMFYRDNKDVSKSELYAKLSYSFVTDSTDINEYTLINIVQFPWNKDIFPFKLFFYKNYKNKKSYNLNLKGSTIDEFSVAPLIDPIIIISNSKNDTFRVKKHKEYEFRIDPRKSYRITELAKFYQMKKDSIIIKTGNCKEL